MIDKYVVENSLRLVSENSYLFSQFRNKSIYITGSTGMIGSQIAVTLLEANEKYNLNLKIFCLVRSLEKAEYIFKDYYNKLNFIVGDICNELICEEEIDYIIHGANSTNSLDFVNKPIDTIMTTFIGTDNILNFAKKKNVQSLVYLSSLEVYGAFDSEKEVSENDFGSLDPSQIRSSYSEGKRISETLCISYGKEYNVPVKIARLCQTFGPGVPYDDNRVFAQFAKSLINKEDIILHTPGTTMRNYCSTKDAILGIFFILLKGKNSESYNIANEDTFISIKDMARLVCDMDDSKSIKVCIQLKDINEMGYNPEVKVKLLSEKLNKLGWLPSQGLDSMFDHLVNSMTLDKEQNGRK